jgi:hypothetical protein
MMHPSLICQGICQGLHADTRALCGYRSSNHGVSHLCFAVLWFDAAKMCPSVICRWLVACIPAAGYVLVLVCTMRDDGESRAVVPVSQQGPSVCCALVEIRTVAPVCEKGCSV